ncbi:MAG: GerAB/ArcD/ProY family transporter [Clostridiales bacterium]|jgi:spore germination protein KB|nr:GerAB/ArcD/ProY family transporter [Clostridiales bacterium]
MNKQLTMRQVVFMYLFISLSPVLRQIPSMLAREAGRGGYLSPFWSVFAILPLTAGILLLIRSFPGLNLYEIMVHLSGRVFAKFITLLYIFWILISLSAKLNIYSLTLQFTLMPKTRSDFFMQIILILVYYALLRGSKTIFRFSEFALGPIILLIGVLFVCAVGRLRTDYLFPMSTINFPSTIRASKAVIAVGGNLTLILFFADKLGIALSKKQIRRLWSGSIIFIFISFVITIFTYGITGAALTANLPFPFYITVKSISFFNIFERFEVLVTLICILSDFVTICIMFIILMRLIQWLFGIRERGFLFLPLAIISYYLSYIVSSTQFEFDYFFRFIILNINLVFQYIIPVFFGLLCILKRKHIKQQY